jgi:hypothetical protein
MVSLAIWVGAAVILLCVGLVVFALGLAALESARNWLQDRAGSLMKLRGGRTLDECSRLGPYRKN